MKEALLYRNLTDKSVQCRACPNFCVLTNGTKGKCGVRENKNGKLYSLVYGKVAAINIDPIEKKPFFHFLPGTESLSFGTTGCNLVCKNCLNWEISQKGKKKINGEEMLPEKIVQTAIKYQCKSISCTYSEPTVFIEYALDTMKLAKKKGLKTCWVSNGYMSKEAVDLISPHLDAINIDFKGFSPKFYKDYCDGLLDPILENMINFKKRRVWVEITTLAIPGLMGQASFEGMADFIVKNLGKETPWHIARFFPEHSWKMRHLYTTPIEIVQKGCDIGVSKGLSFVYGGNVPGLASEDTYCPKCHAKMIDRTGYIIERKDKKGKCSKCGRDLHIIE
jgi:pyruvate formate lyase activating enzyme